MTNSMLHNCNYISSSAPIDSLLFLLCLQTELHTNVKPNPTPSTYNTHSSVNTNSQHEFSSNALGSLTTADFAASATAHAAVWRKAHTGRNQPI